MTGEPFETMPDVMDVKQIAQALHLSQTGAYNLMNIPSRPTLLIGGHKLVLKQDLLMIREHSLLVNAADVDAAIRSLRAIK